MVRDLMDLGGLEARRRIQALSGSVGDLGIDLSR